MQSQDLTPIPIPPRQRWREFRITYLPPVTFLLLVGLICWMWMNYVEPGGIIGEVETVHANIISTVAGTVQDLRVDQLQTVTNGEPLAVLISVDGDQLKAELAAAESDLRLMKARMDLDKTRNLNSYSQLRIALLEERFNLDVARIRLQQAVQEFERAEKMLHDQIISRGMGGARNDFGYEVAVRDRDLLKVEVASREKSVADFEKSVGEMESSGTVRIDPADAAIEQAIRAQREHLQELRKPVLLRSPIDGFVSEIECRPGQKITAGGTILVVSGRKTDRIVAWMHPPILTAPQIGDKVEVRRMGLGGTTFGGTVVRVGSQLEPVSPLLRTPTANPERIEVGLPLLVEAEQAQALIPGEAVQLRVTEKAKVGAN